MKLRWIFMKQVALLVIFSLASCGGQKSPATGDAGGMQRPAPKVDVVTLQPQKVTLTTRLPGRVVAYRTAEVRPQVGGLIEQRLFDEGSMVEAGEALYQIDALRYQAAVDSAEAALRRAEANLNSAATTEKRYVGLLKDKAVSQQQYDDAVAAHEQAQAEVAVAEANLAAAKINLQYTHVTAPISGRIGKSSVSEGALVVAQQPQVMATIQQLDPIYVDVSQSVNKLLRLRKQIQEGHINHSDQPEVRLILADGSEYPGVGELLFSEMTVDESTGSISLRARFPNPDHLLLPGMFVSADVSEGVRENALLAPQMGVMRDRQGHSNVMTVNGENQVESHPIEVSSAIAGNWLVEAGLHPGDRVVVTGLQQIGPGMQVNPVEMEQSSSVKE